MITIILVLIGNRMRELRKKTGLSQEKFALRIGMDRTYYAAVENGKKNISILNIEKIAHGFNMTISEFFSGIEENKKGD